MAMQEAMVQSQDVGNTSAASPKPEEQQTNPAPFTIVKIAPTPVHVSPETPVQEDFTNVPQLRIPEDNTNLAFQVKRAESDSKGDADILWKQFS